MKPFHGVVKGTGGDSADQADGEHLFPGAQDEIHEVFVDVNLCLAWSIQFIIVGPGELLKNRGSCDEWIQLVFGHVLLLPAAWEYAIDELSRDLVIQGQ